MEEHFSKLIISYSYFWTVSAGELFAQGVEYKIDEQSTVDLVFKGQIKF